MTLFEEYAARFARGEQPDLRDYLEQAGDRREELATLVDGWLARVEPPPPDEESVQRMRAWLAGQPPLLELRTRRGLRRSEVVDALIERFGLDRQKRAKVERYYHEVESGSLRPSRRIAEALGELFGTPVRAWKPRPLAAEAAYFRAEEPIAATAAAPARPEPLDEIDELFRGS
jgi:hypothetical protein